MNWKDNIGCRTLIDLLQFVINEEKNTQKKLPNQEYNTQKIKSFSDLWNKLVNHKQYLSQYFQHYYHSNCIINLSLQDIRQLMSEVGIYSRQNYHIIKRCLFNDRKSITMKLDSAKGQEQKQEQWSFRNKNQDKGKDRQRVINTILQKIQDLQKNFQSKRKLSENKRLEYLPQSSFKTRLFFYDRLNENCLQRFPERYYRSNNGLTCTAPTDRFQYRDQQLRERNPNKLQFRQNESDYLDGYSLKNKSLLLARAESIAKMKIRQIEQKAIQKVAYYHRQSAQRKLTISSLTKNENSAKETSNYRCSPTFLDNWNKYACSRKNISGQKLRL